MSVASANGGRSPRARHRTARPASSLGPAFPTVTGRVIQIEPGPSKARTCSADKRHPLVDPHERAARHGLAAVLAGQHDEELLVLRADGVRGILAAVRARLPVDEDRRGRDRGPRRDRARRGRTPRRLGIGAVLDDQEVAGVVPRAAGGTRPSGRVQVVGEATSRRAAAPRRRPCLETISPGGCRPALEVRTCAHDGRAREPPSPKRLGSRAASVSASGSSPLVVEMSSD